MKQLMIFASLVLVLSALFCLLPAKSDMNIYNDVVRIHVIANSNSSADQAVKMAVRDAVLSKVSALMGDASSAADAERIIAENITPIRAVVDDTLVSLGKEKSATVALSKEYYPTRTYDDFSLPCGEYTSLKVMIGDAEGQNFWCVLYPSVCTSGAKAGAIFRQTGFSTEQIKILTDNEKPVYKLKFKLIEILGGQKR